MLTKYKKKLLARGERGIRGQKGSSFVEACLVARCCCTLDYITLGALFVWGHPKVSVPAKTETDNPLSPVKMLPRAPNLPSAPSFVFRYSRKGGEKDRYATPG